MKLDEQKKNVKLFLYRAFSRLFEPTFDVNYNEIIRNVSTNDKSTNFILTEA